MSELLVQRCNGDITEHEGHEMTQQATPHRTSGKSTLAGDLIVFGTVIALVAITLIFVIAIGGVPA
ncbi:hypothetical protein [Gordonia sp. (in: high G+C Gram-positive bacteria)]|uniref:hypothetical protein n=1 Tax=Gordonia sp. (in: high G+C Gram-positive bacteria) TaxID=84139 RepID=UPI002FD94EB8